jgi:putative chitinase
MLFKVGSQGEQVKQIQRKLGVIDTGNFGPKTEAAVKKFQRENGLLDDGVVGQITWNKMFPIIIPASDFPLEKFIGHIPEEVLVQIPETAKKFNITNNLRLLHFLAQCAHESGNWLFKVEIASGRAYEGRKDLGNTQPGDGVRFKGRGYIQLTGRANYKKFSEFVGEDCVSNPDLVATKYPLMSAAFFFNSNNLWRICDRGVDNTIITLVTRRVNGGTKGLDDRIRHFRKYQSLLV